MEATVGIIVKRILTISFESYTKIQNNVSISVKVLLQDNDQSQGPKIADIQKNKRQLNKTRSRRSIVHDGDDAYSYRYREVGGNISILMRFIVMHNLQLFFT